MEDSFAYYHASSQRQNKGNTIIVKNGPFTAATSAEDAEGTLLDAFDGSYLTPNALNTFTLTYNTGTITLGNTDPLVEATDTSGSPLDVDNLWVDDGFGVLSNWIVCGEGLGK